MDPRRLLTRMQSGRFENVRFRDAERLAIALGFELDHVRGSHHVYRHRLVADRLNLQPRGDEAKAYQLRQLLGYVSQYDLSLEVER
jgi:predicted RNA binding protein YcfA (HicA-like mRNA interferase family)